MTPPAGWLRWRWAPPAVVAIALTLASEAGAQSPVRSPPDAEELRAIVQRTFDEWSPPGLAVAVVRNDSLLWAQGYGVREAGRPELVDEHTLFAVGSTSKAFTTAALAMLVEEGKLKWDDRATEHLPGFQLFDPAVTRELTVRDLLTHRVGLVRGDRLWHGTEYTRSEILHRVRFLEPTWPFRYTFGYQNIAYLAAGEIVPRLAGMSWDDFVAERIFRPLGMTRSTISVRHLSGRDNVAQPHLWKEEGYQVIPYRNIDNIAPAGSVNSSVEEMSRWLRLHLNRGVFQGRRLLAEASVEEMHTPWMILPTEGGLATNYEVDHFLFYGLGWFLQDFRGHKVVQHGGGIDGMTTFLAIVPDQGLGVVAVTNGGGLPVYGVVWDLLDALLGLPHQGVAEAFLRQSREQLARAEERRLEVEAGRVQGTRPSLALAAYAGEYHDPMYGTLTVEEAGGRLGIAWGGFHGDLEHWHHDTFRLTWKDPTYGPTFAVFRLNARGVVGELGVEDLTEFVRAPEAGAGRGGDR
jgi:CubicO group peptidase (beta-lactamase class C family)